MLQVVNICTQVISKGVYSEATFSKEGHIENISQIFLIKHFLILRCVYVYANSVSCAQFERAMSSTTPAAAIYPHFYAAIMCMLFIFGRSL